ncbi:hypothetical protein TNCV_4636121 [Trichonephila clavipes]|uniref:Uncharacterized protein n=1 Tax=Trichonephila clavipes TaxID=2585209 RepID=A0A8X6R5C0_TRICX|nr:hypothetical protein TNCV_4636121 [Trichonephila clavipes]
MQVHEIHQSKGLNVRLSLAVVLSTIQMTVRFSSVPPQFRGRTPWGRIYDLSSHFSIPQPHERTCNSTATLNMGGASPRNPKVVFFFLVNQQNQPSHYAD